MKCPECDFDSPDGMAFCGRCGEEMQTDAAMASTEISCPECDAAMPGTATFCGRCGYHLQTPSDVPEASQASPNVDSPPNSPEAATEECPDSPPSDPEAAAAKFAATELSAMNSAPRAHVKDPSQKVTAELQSPQGAPREMVLLPVVWFPMGSVGQSGNGDERPRHQVELTAFYIDRCAVTNADYEQFDGSHRRLRSEVSEGDDDPVVFVTYDNC